MDVGGLGVHVGKGVRVGISGLGNGVGVFSNEVLNGDEVGVEVADSGVLDGEGVGVGGTLHPNRHTSGARMMIYEHHLKYKVFIYVLLS